MIVVDLNLLVYAYDEASDQHAAAKKWFADAVNGDDVVGLPLVAVVGFLRLFTSQRLFSNPLSTSEAIGIVRSWLDQPNVRLLSPSERHWQVLTDVVAAGQARGDVVTDAHIAALTIEHGATLATNDRGFARFPKLKVRYPLAS